MIKRGVREVEMSVRAVNMVHDWEKLMQSLIMKKGRLEYPRLRRAPEENGNRIRFLRARITLKCRKMKSSPC